MTQHRPGRINTLGPDEEIVLKQFWAYTLKYFGFDLDIPNNEIGDKESYVASNKSKPRSDSVTNNLTRSDTINSSLSSHSSRGFWGSSKKSDVSSEQAVSGKLRARQIKEQGRKERYQQVKDASERYKHIFLDFYKITEVAGVTYEDPEELEDEQSNIDEHDNDDAASVDSFITATTSVISNLEDDLCYFRMNYQGRIKLPHELSNGDNGNGKTMLKNGEASDARKRVQTKTDILPFLKQYEPHNCFKSFLLLAKNAAFDNFLMRFIRARKFSVEDSMAMFFKSLSWRESDMLIYEWFLESDGRAFFSGKEKGFIKNLERKKAFLHGYDKNGNNIFFFRAGLHFGSDSSFRELQRYALSLVEWCLLKMKEVTLSNDLFTLVFDLTGFTLKNADYSAIKFLCEIFEAHYPETLEKIVIFNAPWIFSKVWSIIKNWLDPNVAAKVVFCKTAAEASSFVDPKYIPKAMGGNSDYNGDYMEPSRKDLRPPKQKDAYYDKLRAQRSQYFLLFLETTRRWIEATNSDVSSKYLKDKIDLNYKMAETYIEMDPYIRCPCLFDRNGVMDISL